MYKTTSLVLLLAVSLAGISQADIIQNVTLDTPTLSGAAGFLDLQLNPAAAGAPAATVTIRSFSTDGLLGASAIQTGGVSGSLSAGTLTLQNLANPPANESAYNFTFGTMLSFVADFSGPAISTPDASNPLTSTFALSLFDAGGNTLRTLDYTITPSGTLATSTTPEPALFWLTAAGFALLFVLRRARRRMGPVSQRT